MTPFWIRHQGSDLAQGDWLPNCLVPNFNPDFGASGMTEQVAVGHADLIVVTQSCDLAKAAMAVARSSDERVETKICANFVVLCPIFSLADFEQVNPQFAAKGVWEQVRKGQREGLHLLASPEVPHDNRQALVVDFRQLFSLPFPYLVRHAEKLGER